MDSTCLVKSVLRAEVPQPRESAGKVIGANNNMALAA